MAEAELEVRLEGADFALRRWRRDDLDALLRHADDVAVVRGLSDRFPHPYTRADGEAFLAGQVIDFNNPVFAIEIDGEACGGIGARFGQLDRARTAELGYWLGRRWWGQGRMTRIVADYLDWLVPSYRLHRVQISALDNNPGSAAVALKNGFVEEGRLRAAVCKYGQLHDLRVFGRTWPLSP